MTARHQSDRTLLARAAAHAKWAQCADPTAATAAARNAFQKKFLDGADPTGELRLEISKLPIGSPEREKLEGDLDRRAEHARKAYYTRLALASARARRK